MSVLVRGILALIIWLACSLPAVVLVFSEQSTFPTADVVKFFMPQASPKLQAKAFSLKNTAALEGVANEPGSNGEILCQGVNLF